MQAATETAQQILSSEITHVALFLVALLIFAAVAIVWLTVPLARAFNKTLEQTNSNNLRLTTAIVGLEKSIEMQTEQLQQLSGRMEKLEDTVARFRPWWRVF